MKCIFISDLHGDFPIINEECELVCICGDISPLAIQSNDRKMKKWLLEVFKPWCEALPCDKVLFIAGNHDWIASRDPKFMLDNFKKDEKVTYLYHEKYIYTSKNGIEHSIFGTPFCKQFGNWAFMEDDDKLMELFKDIPNNLDLLLTHDAPYGATDVLLQKNIPWYTDEHIGSKSLQEMIWIREPKMNIHGHIHSSSRDFEFINRTRVANCSIKDERYAMVYDPLVVEI